MRHPLRGLTVLVAVAAMLSGSMLTALAKPAEHFFDEGSFSDVFDCDGLELEEEVTFREHVLINGRGQDRVPHFQANVSATHVITNPANGKTFTISFRFLDQDQSVTGNDDGTLTVIILLAGRVQHYGPDGKLLFLDAGQLVVETLWDDGGTFLDREELKAVGRSDTADRDFCADMHELLG